MSATLTFTYTVVVFARQAAAGSASTKTNGSAPAPARSAASAAATGVEGGSESTLGLPMQRSETTWDSRVAAMHAHVARGKDRERERRRLAARGEEKVFVCALCATVWCVGDGIVASAGYL